MEEEEGAMKGIGSDIETDNIDMRTVKDMSEGGIITMPPSPLH